MDITAVRRYALSLPEAVEAPHFHYASFRVKKKIFVTVPPDATHIHVFVPDEAREKALILYPAFVEKLLWGNKVAGVRVNLADANADAVHDLILQAWRAKAPKALQKSGVAISQC
ncbi:MAG: MmcQ/YjbR family DNA-binding protein [Burkholderiales bacterium]|nr:MmcQ/YjbR family DNA-binding protein [Burkholderiales bacterium]